jgi:hypothetical protein
MNRTSERGNVTTKKIMLFALLVLSLPVNGTAQTSGAPPYHLDVGRPDGTLGLGDLRSDAPPMSLAQAAGAPAPAEAPAAEPEGQSQSLSELNQKITNPLSDIWALQNQFNNYKLANGH